MWKYIVAVLLILIGSLEMVLAINKRLRDELMKNSPMPFPRSAPTYLLMAGASAFVMALALIFYDRFF
jgi:hypothetical protein